MHDIRKGIHHELRKFGLPIVTAGNSSSPFFVDRFYDLANRYSYGTSNVIGSQLFYLEELGVPYFLFGEENREVDSHGKSISYYYGADKDLVSKVKELFAFENLGTSSEKVEFVNRTLGLDVDPEVTKKELKPKLIYDFLHIMPLLLLSLTSLLIRVVSSPARTWLADYRNKH
jgi:hypothetical protein